VSNKKRKPPWPTQAAMAQVYEASLWGQNGSPFYSGSGSHHPAIVVPYVQAVTGFLQSFPAPMTVCDLGCGDFNVGRALVPYAKHYTAVDIVPELIDYNRTHFQMPHLEFQCLDISKDPLPTANVVLIRQVLQHLCNTEVQQVIEKLSQYQYVLLTEHVPEGDFVPNMDIISGQGIRLKKQSGLDVLYAPFHLKPKEKQQLLRQKAIGHKGVIVTQLFRMY
jgi:SAM-dependent methyltransferase